MGRYRPPREAGSAYITSTGKRRLQDEFNYLWKVKRPQVTQSVSEAAAQGDRSENAEYIYGKKQLREIDARIRFISKRLEVLNVVDQLPTDRKRVFFGAWVRLINDRGEEAEYRIVGPDEFDMQAFYISIDSPLARALLSKQGGEEVEVRTPKGTMVYELLEVQYKEESG